MKKVLLFAMKRLVVIALLLFPLFAHAEEVEIDGLWYDLNAEDKTAEVMLSKGEPYSGDIVIPEKVSYEDAEYNFRMLQAFHVPGAKEMRMKCLEKMNIRAPKA